MSKISGAEVAKHNSKNDCWMVLDSKVYDVSKFVFEHPGGATILLKNAGSVSIHQRVAGTLIDMTTGCNRRV